MPIDERRRSPRLSVELNVVFKKLGRPEDPCGEVAKNISAGGVFIETSRGLPLGAPVRMEVDAGSGLLALEGEVIRVEARAGARTGRKVTGMAVLFRPGQSALDTLGSLIEAKREQVDGQAPGMSSK